MVLSFTSVGKGEFAMGTKNYLTVVRTSRSCRAVCVCPVFDGTEGGGATLNDLCLVYTSHAAPTPIPHFRRSAYPIILVSY